jgi:hypothetical protein
MEKTVRSSLEIIFRAFFPLKRELKRVPLKGVLKKAPLKGVLKKVPFFGVRVFFIDEYPFNFW